MPKNISYEEKTIDLLQKVLILELYKSGVKVKEIKKILKVSQDKVSAITQYLSKSLGVNDER